MLGSALEISLLGICPVVVPPADYCNKCVQVMRQYHHLQHFPILFSLSEPQIAIGNQLHLLNEMEKKRNLIHSRLILRPIFVG